MGGLMSHQELSIRLVMNMFESHPKVPRGTGRRGRGVLEGYATVRRFLELRLSSYDETADGSEKVTDFNNGLVLAVIPVGVAPTNPRRSRPEGAGDVAGER